MIIKDVRFDWLFVFEPGNKSKYGVCCIIKKGSESLQRVQEAIDKAKASGVAKGLFTVANTKSTSFKKCLRDGDVEIEEEDRPKHYAGCMFFNASNKVQPGIVGPDMQPILDTNSFFSGCYGHIDVNFYPYKHPEGGKGIGAGMNHIMMTKEGDRLDGRQSVEDAFAGLAVEDELQ